MIMITRELTEHVSSTRCTQISWIFSILMRNISAVVCDGGSPDGLEVSDPPRVVFILLWVKNGSAYKFFSHVNSPTLL